MSRSVRSEKIWPVLSGVTWESLGIVSDWLVRVRVVSGVRVKRARSDSNLDVPVDGELRSDERQVE